MLSKKIASFLVPVFLLFFAACESEAGQHTAAATGATAPEGIAVFRKYCVSCHGADGKLGLNGAHDLSKSVLSVEERVVQITKGKNLMTPFGEILSPEEIRAVAEYTTTFK